MYYPISLVLSGGISESSKYVGYAKKLARHCQINKIMSKTVTVADKVTIRIRNDRSAKICKVYVDAVSGSPFYQFLCPTLVPTYANIQGFEALTGSAVAVDLTKLPISNDFPIPPGAVFATGTTVEEPPSGAKRFPLDTVPNNLFLQRVIWQVDGLGTTISAPSNSKPDVTKLDYDYSKALLTPWFVGSSFSGNVAKRSYELSSGLGDWGYDLPPTKVSGKNLSRTFMEPDADWPSNATYYTTADGQRFVVMLSSDFKLYAWNASTPKVPAETNEYSWQNQRVTIPNSVVASCAIERPSWATIPDTAFRDQVNPSNFFDFPIQPRYQVHFRFDGKRMAALLYERHESEAHLLVRELETDPWNLLDPPVHHITFEDAGAATVAPNSIASDPPYPTLADDRMGWAEWDVVLEVDLAGDISFATSLVQDHGPDTIEEGRVPVGIGYAAPTDWAGHGRPDLAPGDLLVAYMYLFVDEPYQQFHAWRTGGVIGSGATASFAYLTIERALDSLFIQRLNLYDRRGFFNLSTSHFLTELTREPNGLSRFNVSTYNLDLTTLSFVCIVNQYNLEAEDTLLDHTEPGAPFGYPIVAKHDISVIGFVYGNVVINESLVSFHPEPLPALNVLTDLTDVSSLISLTADNSVRVELAIGGGKVTSGGIEDLPLPHWAMDMVITEKPPGWDAGPDNVENPSRLMFRIFPHPYDGSAFPNPVTPNRTYSEAFALALDDLDGDIATHCVDISSFKEALQAIVDGPLAEHIQNRLAIPALPGPNGYFTNDVARLKVSDTLLYFGAFGDGTTSVANTLYPILHALNRRNVNNEFRQAALSNYNYNRYIYNNSYLDTLLYSNSMKLGMNGWVAISSAFLVPTKPYRIIRAYWYSPDVYPTFENPLVPDFNGELLRGYPPPALGGEYTTQDLRYLNEVYNCKYMDGWTNKAAFDTDTLQIKQVDSIFNVHGNARYSHRQFYNLAYKHNYTNEDFSVSSTEVNEGKTAFSDGVYLKVTTPVNSSNPDQDILIQYRDPFEFFTTGNIALDNKAIGLGKHFFIGNRGWKP